uniref:Uncharacterized protein n=1 Tax=Sipha flava TaxID=143950 RepID=A0A2S2R7N4_9HEMI
MAKCAWCQYDVCTSFGCIRDTGRAAVCYCSIFRRSKTFVRGPDGVFLTREPPTDANVDTKTFSCDNMHRCADRRIIRYTSFSWAEKKARDELQGRLCISVFMAGN